MGFRVDPIIFHTRANNTLERFLLRGASGKARATPHRLDETGPQLSRLWIKHYYFPPMNQTLLKCVGVPD